MNQRSIWALVLCGTTSLLLYGTIYGLSSAFAYEQHEITRPLRRVLLLFGLSFLVYLAAQWLALNTKSRLLMPTIVTFALAFRAIIVFSVPIQEVDIYRYVWDGIVSTCGVSPFDYSPQDVLQATAGQLELEPGLALLVERRDSSAAIGTVLERVHFGELPTVYPPVSQVVFAVASSTTPENATVEQRLLIMKVWLLLFDLGTIGMIALTLRWAKLNPAWLIAYAWCPLVIKEFANSGHLDAIAVFFSSAAVYFACQAFFPSLDQTPERRPVNSFRNASIGSGMLALAVGAKLYPVALAPLLCAVSLHRLGRNQTFAIAVIFMLVTGICLSPMLSRRDVQKLADVKTDNRFTPVDELPPTPTTESHTSNTATKLSRDPQAGLKAFLSRWMMNDFIFLNVLENLTPNRERTGDVATPWFVFVPNTARTAITSGLSRSLSIDASRVPFLMARAITASIFLGLSLYWAWYARYDRTAADWLERIFLTMAWFWLLLPTLNPWYWIWALPWIPFAKNRVWLVMSGLLFIYYLRFYFAAHFPDEEVAFSRYRGEWFFHYVVVWFEYLPWFVCLVWMHFNNRRKVVKSSEQSTLSLTSL